MGTWSATVCAIVAAASGGALLLGAGIASADEAAEPDKGHRFHLAYTAPASCPDRAAFLAAIRLRTNRPQLAAEGEAAPTFTVSVEPRQGTSVGRLEVRDVSGPPQERTVSSATCGEVAKALALVAALILDPDAETGAEPEAPPPTRDDGPPVAGAVAIPPAPPPPVVRRARPERPVLRPVDRHKVHVSAVGEVGMTGAIAPVLAPGAGASVDVGLAPPPGRAFAFAPSFRIGPTFAMTSTDLPATGSHGYWWVGGTARLCPVSLSVPGNVRLVPCAGLQVGAHHGSTRGVPNGTSSTDIWVAPTAGASLEWVLTSAVAVELQGGAVVPIVRTRFFLAPDTTIFEIPAISGAAGIACRLRFW